MSSIQPPPPYQVPPYSPSAAQLQKSGKRKMKWVIVASVVGVLLFFTLAAGGLVALVFGSLRSSDAYQFAVQTASGDPRVLSRLGAPVKPGWLISGTINLQNDAGRADLSIPLHGATHQGTIHVVGKKAEGVWAYEMLSLRVDDSQETVDLLARDAKERK